MAAALLFGCTVQGAVGFGGGLFAIPLIVWAGMSLPEAIMIGLAGMFVQCAWNLFRYRDHIEFRSLLPMFFMRVVFLPVGIVLLGVLVSLGAARVKQVVGLFVLLALLMQWLIRVKPRERVAWGWTALAGSCSGLTAGLVGMGGPPVVLWVMAHDWPSRKSRTFLWATFLMVMPINIVLLIVKFGSEMVWPLLLGLSLAPLVMLASELGQRVGGLMNRSRLRTVTLWLLLLLAISSVLGPMIG